MAGSFVAINVLLMILAAIVLPVIVVWTLIKVLQGLFWGLGMLGRGISATVRGVGRGTVGGIRHVAVFARNEVVDALRFGGGVLTAAVILPLAFLNFCLGRWSSAAHFGRALEDELISSGVSLYRVAVGNPVRLLGLGILTDGVESRLPDLMARAPRPRRKAGRTGRFDGYKVTGTLTAGGSGARLYIARPKPEKVNAFRAAGHPDPGEVVIKSFALGAGSTLPQIVRESRALEAASRLGLVLEHQLGDDSFHYVMPFVPGENLDTVIANMHAKAGESGLAPREMGIVVGHASDLLATLDRFHAGGLWHKDIKPSNLIVSGGRVHLVDLGLVTPLASAMTLTTHGTEYFRDPEMVRLAMKGVKVHEVDGVRFDIYSAGAVLYSMIENSFPAHGSLSIITKACPEALKWIVRRAMAEMNARYAHAAEMLADLRVLAAARDPYAVQPADLPSVSGQLAVNNQAPGNSRVDWSVLGGARAKPDTVGDAPRARAEALRPVAAAASQPPPTPDVIVRRRTSRALLAAGAWALLVLGALGSLRAFRQAEFHGGRTGAQVSHEAERVRVARASVGPAIGAQRAQHASAQLEAQWLERLGGSQLLQGQGTPGTGAAAEAHGRILVLEDIGPEGDRDVLASLRSALAKSGFEVLGGRRSEGASAEEMELEARARSVAGLADPSDAAAVRRLEDFLDARGELDALIWISADSADGQAFQYRLLLRQQGRLPEPERFSPEREVARRP